MRKMDFSRQEKKKDRKTNQASPLATCISELILHRSGYLPGLIGAIQTALLTDAEDTYKSYRLGNKPGKNDEHDSVCMRKSVLKID